jgi:outer membrane murein-binding lipoprotein Lpp
VLGAPIALIVGALALSSMSSSAQARPERLSDNDVKALIAQVDEGRDEFEGNLDGGFKGSTVQGANGATKVSRALQDYQDSTQKLKNGFTSDYASGPEVATVLKQSTAIDAFMRQASGTMKGRSEWDRQAGHLKQLAAAYGAGFPLTNGATARRMNDKEVATTAGLIAAAADRFKNDVNAVTALAKPDKDAAKKDADLVGQQANAVKSRIGDGKPATSEMQELIAQVRRLQTVVTAHPALGATNWQSLQASLGKLQLAFGLTPAS